MNVSRLELHVRDMTLEQAVLELEKEHAEALDRDEDAQAALVLNDLGVVYLLLNRIDGRRVLSQAQRTFIELDNMAGKGRALGNLAQLEQRAGNRDSAGVSYLCAAETFHGAAALSNEYITRRRLCRSYFQRRALLIALSETERASEVIPNASVFDKIQRWFYALALRFIGVM